MAALVKRVAKLKDAGLQACHYIEEFTLRRIHPLGHWEKLAYEYPRHADPSRKPAASKMFSLYFPLLMIDWNDLINASHLHSSDSRGYRSARGTTVQ
jgi:hypothetical protein